MKAEGETVNDGGRKLKIGTFPYQVIAANMAVVKSDPTGKTQQVVIGLRNGESYDCKCYLSVMADNDQQREIAEKTLRAIVQAAGITGLVKPETLKKLVGTWVLITAVETVSKTDKTKSYVNIQTVEACDPDDADEVEAEEEEEEEAPPAPKPTKKPKPAPEPEPKEDEDDEEVEEEEEEEEEPAAKPAKGGKKATPW